jgi:hypothetical protein
VRRSGCPVELAQKLIFSKPVTELLQLCVLSFGFF